MPEQENPTVEAPMPVTDPETGAPNTLPPEAEEGTGVALVKGLPVNHRLRAEALVERGDTTDPEGEISDDLIADTKARLESEAADHKANEKAAGKGRGRTSKSEG